MKTKNNMKKVTVLLLGAVVLQHSAVNVYASELSGNIQIGSEVLAPTMEDCRDYYDFEQHDRVTEAPVVYYGNNPDQSWLSIGYDGNGAVRESGTVTLFAEDNLTRFQEFNASGDSNTYGDSDINRVLVGENGEGGYYSSMFSEEEREAIQERTLVHDEFQATGNDLCDGVSDENGTSSRMWLLSTHEADLLSREYREADGFWWQRSPGNSDNSVSCVGDSGCVYNYGCSSALQEGVRPAFNINISSIVFTSAAEGGKISGEVGPDALTMVTDYDGSNGWKLTITDSARDGFNANRTDTDALTAGGTVGISYSGALTGANEYISAIITTMDDTVLYYGNIASCTSESGTTNISLPTELPEGCKLYVFQERCSGDYLTDFSSALMNLTAPGVLPSPIIIESVETDGQTVITVSQPESNNAQATNIENISVASNVQPTANTISGQNLQTSEISTTNAEANTLTTTTTTTTNSTVIEQNSNKSADSHISSNTDTNSSLKNSGLKTNSVIQRTFVKILPEDKILTVQITKKRFYLLYVLLLILFHGTLFFILFKKRKKEEEGCD